jgi:hypothetical protein
MGSKKAFCINWIVFAIQYSVCLVLWYSTVKFALSMVTDCNQETIHGLGFLFLLIRENIGATYKDVQDFLNLKELNND